MNYQAMRRMVRKGVDVGLYMLGAIGRAAESVRLYNELERMGDDELATLGIRRDRIGRYVAENMDPVTLKSIGAPQSVDTRSFVEDVDVTPQRRAA